MVKHSVCGSVRVVGSLLNVIEKFGIRTAGGRHGRDGGVAIWLDCVVVVVLTVW